MEATNENTIVLIPSYNESQAIGEVVSRIKKLGINVLVVDDGSSDNTAEIASGRGVDVLRFKENSGKGTSILKGIERISSLGKYDWVVIMDGDGQHSPDDIKTMMAAANEGDVDVIVGNRMGAATCMPRVRYWTNRFTSWAVSSLCNTCIPDTQCGFRMVRISILERMALESKRYDIESEILIKAAGKGARIVSVPVETIYGEEVSEIHPGRDTINFFRLILGCYMSRRKNEK